MYKITDNGMRTHGSRFQWELGVKQTIARTLGYPDERASLCSGAWFHYYETKLAARALNLIQGAFWEDNCRLFKIEVGGLIKVAEGKAGCTELTLVEEIPFVSMGRTELEALARPIFAHLSKVETGYLLADRTMTGLRLMIEAHWTLLRAVFAKREQQNV